MRRLILSVLLLIVCSLTVRATAQAPDVLIVDGKFYKLYSNPLEDYYGKKKRPQFFVEPNAKNSGNWRGYVATWEIINNRLYLTKIDSWFCNNRMIKTKNGCRRVVLQNLFGTKVNNKVAASWFSGSLRVPDGRELQYVHMGYGSIYEREIVFEVVAGEIVKKEIIDNAKKLPPPPLPEVKTKDPEEFKNWLPETTLFPKSR
jgi:hypothetical protein